MLIKAARKEKKKRKATKSKRIDLTQLEERTLNLNWFPRMLKNIIIHAVIYCFGNMF